MSKRRDVRRRSRSQPARRWTSLLGWFTRSMRKPASPLLFPVTLIGIVVFLLFIFWQSRQWEPRVPQFESTRWDSSWPEVPYSVRLVGRPFSDVVASYAFAARRPEVFRYIPCYCGCARRRHRSLLDCFVRGRGDDDRPLWEPEARRSRICLDIAGDVIRDVAQGRSLPDIRKTIDSRYPSQSHPGTSTPMPPPTSKP